MKTEISKYDLYKMLPIALVERAISEKWDLSQCYLLKLKSLHKKPIFYKFSLRPVAEQLGVSHNTLSHHINILIKKGCLSFSGENLMITGVSKLLKKNRSCNVAVKLSDNKQEQQTFIRGIHIIRNLIRQDRNIKIDKNAIELDKNSSRYFSKVEIKSIRKEAAKRASVAIYHTDYTLMSNIKFGKLCNRSQSTGQKIQKALNLLGIIFSEKNKVKVSDQKMNIRAFIEVYGCIGKYQLSRDGYVYMILPNKVTLLSRRSS